MKITEVVFEMDEMNGADENDQLATVLRKEIGGDWWWVGDTLNYSEHEGYSVEVQVCPRAEFSNFCRERAADNNNPEPSEAEIEQDAHDNYSTLIWNNEEYVLIPQI